jgi:hypothetical protein
MQFSPGDREYDTPAVTLLSDLACIHTDELQYRDRRLNRLIDSRSESSRIRRTDGVCSSSSSSSLALH